MPNGFPAVSFSAVAEDVVGGGGSPKGLPSSLVSFEELLSPNGLPSSAFDPGVGAVFEGGPVGGSVGCWEGG